MRQPLRPWTLSVDERQLLDDVLAAAWFAETRPEAAPSPKAAALAELLYQLRELAP